MKILLDTHIIIWALTDDPQLSSQARKLITAQDNIILYSTVSLWEIAIKNQKAPEKCPYHEAEIMSFCEQAGMLPLEITNSHVLALRNLRIREGHFLSNLDPFDRMLLCQAKAEQCLFLSHDTIFENYDESCIMLV